MQLYQRTQRLPATSPFPKRLVFPSLNSNKELIWLPRSESLVRRCRAWIQLRTQCTFCLAWEQAESSWKLFCGWKNTTKKMITISFLFRANEYTWKGLEKNSSGVQFLKTGVYDSLKKNFFNWFGERNMDLLFHVFMLSFVDSYMCPDQESNAPPWRIGML